MICSAFGYPVVPHLAKSLGYRLRLADCETETLGMDPDALARTISSETRVVIATHLYGVPCRIDEIAEIAQRHGAVLIEGISGCYFTVMGLPMERLMAALAEFTGGAVGYFGATLSPGNPDGDHS